MLIEQVARLSPLERFIYWIRERHQIHLRRKLGNAKPWTDDQVLQSYFFTNPYRENDKVTVWFRENVRGPLRDDPRVLFATICFRWFNWPMTGKLLMGVKPAREPKFHGTARGGFGLLEDWDCQAAVEHLSAFRDSGNQVFTGAYNISNSGSTKPKINRVCEDYIQPVWARRNELLHQFIFPLSFGPSHSLTMQAAHKNLMTLPGLRGSGFMAYEVVCDLRYTYLLENAPDKCTWSNPGPGAKRGINRLLGRPLDQPVRDWETESVKLLLQVQRFLPKMPAFEMREIEHSLCEFDKYERARLGDGHMKRRYQGA